MTGLIIVPARANSLGVPGKNVRSIAGVPLIAWAIEKTHALVDMALAEHGEDIMVVVASDSGEVLMRALAHTRYSSAVHQSTWLVPLARPADQAGPDQTIHDLVAWVVERVEAIGLPAAVDWIGIHQPTSPTLEAQTMWDMLTAFLHDPDTDSMQTAFEDSTFRWSEEHGMDPPNRVNRQDRSEADRRYAETGGFHLVRGFPWEGTSAPTIGKTHRFHLVRKSEAIDIDTPMDWAAAETVLDRPTVAVLTHGSPTIGSGHLRRSVALAHALLPYAQVEIFPWSTPKRMREAAGVAGPNIRDADLEALWQDHDTVVVDALDELDVRAITSKHPGKTVRIESTRIDSHAEPINGLYSFPTGSSGPKWVDIRDEFKYLPRFMVAPSIGSVLVSMGGVDPSGLSVAVCNLLVDAPELDEVLVTLIAPPLGGYDDHLLDERVDVVEDASMAWEMANHDLLVTTRGRTQFEAAHVGVPTIAIPANQREYWEHVSPDGVRPLLADMGDEFDAHKALPMLVPAAVGMKDPVVRLHMSESGQNAVDGHGMDRIVERVLNLAREQRRTRPPITVITGTVNEKNPDG